MRVFVGILVFLAVSSVPLLTVSCASAEEKEEEPPLPEYLLTWVDMDTLIVALGCDEWYYSEGGVSLSLGRGDVCDDPPLPPPRRYTKTFSSFEELEQELSSRSYPEGTQVYSFRAGRWHEVTQEKRSPYTFSLQGNPYFHKCVE